MGIRTPCEKCRKACGINLSCPDCSKPLPVSTTCTGCNAVIVLSDDNPCYFVDIIADNGSKSKEARISTTSDKDVMLSIDYKPALEEAARVSRQLFKVSLDGVQDAKTLIVKGIKAMTAMGMKDGEIQAFMALEPVPERTYYRLKGGE